MFTINGIGFRFYGYTPKQQDGTRFATVWFTFAYFPIFPIRRAKVLFHSKDSYKILERTSPRIAEVLTTYFWSWVIMPIFLFTPAFLATNDVAVSLGLPSYRKSGALFDKNFTITEFLLIFSIIWLIGAVIYLANWDEKRRTQ